MKKEKLVIKKEDLSLKALKTFVGMEGMGGFNVNLYWKNKKIAMIHNDDSGGENGYDWMDRPEIGTDRIDVRVKRDDGSYITYKGTPFESAVQDIVNEEPPIDMGDMYNDGKDHFMAADMDSFIYDMINEVLKHREELKQINRFKKQCKNKTVYKLKTDDNDTYWTVNTKFDSRVKAHLQKKFGDNLLLIYNEKYGVV